MPIYEYSCNQCGRVSEILTGIGSQSDQMLCKHCGNSDLKKLMSLTSSVSRDSSKIPGATCCGKAERCDTPPCSNGASCRRDSGSVMK